MHASTSTNLLHAIASVGTTMTILVLSIAISFFPCRCVCSAAKDIILEDFGTVYGTVQYSETEPKASRTDPMHSWYALTDPVMGGQSIGSATAADGIGVFDGQVRTVPSLNAPGFIAMQTRDGFWPDLTSCKGLKITALSSNSYNGFKVSFGTAHVTGNSPYARGYKAPFTPGIHQYTDVSIPFTAFSDDWDAATGEILVSCQDDKEYCPDDDTLHTLKRFEIMAEGVNGSIDLKLKYITAYGCDDDVVEIDPNPNQNLRPGGRQGGPLGGRDHADVEYVGNVIPEVFKNGDVRIEQWPDARHAWYALNDPVMGGKSTSTVSIENDMGIFEGKVVDVPYLNAPGFIKMETRGGEFPDVSHCRALKLEIRSAMDYGGLHISFGVHHAEGAPRFVRGYKAPLHILQSDTFHSVVVPFTDFSDHWDAATGDIQVHCLENSIHCPDEATLRYFTTLSIMAEGMDGKVHVEIKSIDATDCEYTDTGGRSWAWFGILIGILASGFLGVYAGRHTAHASGFCDGLEILFGRRDGIDHKWPGNGRGVGVDIVTQVESPPSNPTPITSLRRQMEAVPQTP